MKQVDPWHYARKDLATQIVSMFESGLSSSLIFFAPRRMGKTEFLRKDITPVAESLNWQVFYFSFFDCGENPTLQFKQALEDFLLRQGLLNKAKKVLKAVTRISGSIGRVNAGVEFSKVAEKKDTADIKELLRILMLDRKTLLLMDEVQVLAMNSRNDHFIASFRTVLDMYKDRLKVIFTGSSQAGLRKMFSEARAPFFHFGQNLDFPELDRGFTDHLAKTFKLVSHRKINENELWQAFLDMQKVPLLIRSLVERMVLNPALTIAEVKAELIEKIFSNRRFEEQWKDFSLLEQLVVKEIAIDKVQLFAKQVRAKFAKNIGLKDLPAISVQAAIKKLLRRGIIGKFSDTAGYFIDDPSFKNWLLQDINSKNN